MRASAARVALAIATAAVSAGCISRDLLSRPPGGRFEPIVVSPSRAGALGAAVDEVTVSADDETVLARLALDADGPAFVREVALSSAAAPPCRAGIVARTLELDGQERWNRPLGLTGRHTLQARFDGAAARLAASDAVLDVTSASDEGCLRLPLGAGAGGEPTLAPSPRRLVAGAKLRMTVPVERLYQPFIDDELRFATWLGPALVGGEAGWIASTCRTACGTWPTLSFPLWLVAEVVPLRYRRFGLGVEGAYGIEWGPVSHGPDWLLTGPRAALHIVELAPAVWPNAPVARGRGFELSVSYLRSARGPLAPAAFIGLGLVAF